jgi:hypothetical protein
MVGDEVKEDELGGTWEIRNAYKILVEPEGMRPLGRPTLGRRIILTIILKKKHVELIHMIRIEPGGGLL